MTQRAEQFDFSVDVIGRVAEAQDLGGLMSTPRIAPPVRDPAGVAPADSCHTPCVTSRADAGPALDNRSVPAERPLA
jgi:hypothetical protein